MRTLCLCLWATAAIVAFPLGATAQSSARPKPTLGVMAFTNAAMVDRDAWESQRQGVAETITTMLRYHTAVDVLEREQLRVVLDELALGASGQVDPQTAARVGKLLGAQYMLLGTITVDTRNRLRLSARAVEVETSRILSGEMVTGSADDVLLLTDRLTEQLLANLRLPPLPPRGNPDGEQSPDRAPAATPARAPTPAPSPASATPTRTAVAVGSGNSTSTGAADTAARQERTLIEAKSTVADAAKATEKPAGLPRTTGPSIRRTAAALNVPRGGKEGALALRLLSQGIKAEEDRRFQEAQELYKRALAAVPEYVAARDRLARLRSI